MIITFGSSILGSGILSILIGYKGFALGLPCGIRFSGLRAPFQTFGVDTLQLKYVRPGPNHFGPIAVNGYGVLQQHRVLVQDLEPAIDIVIPGLGHYVSNGGGRWRAVFRRVHPAGR